MRKSYRIFILNICVGVNKPLGLAIYVDYTHGVNVCYNLVFAMVTVAFKRKLLISAL